MRFGWGGETTTATTVAPAGSSVWRPSGYGRRGARNLLKRVGRRAIDRRPIRGTHNAAPRARLQLVSLRCCAVFLCDCGTDEPVSLPPLLVDAALGLLGLSLPSRIKIARQLRRASAAAVRRCSSRHVGQRGGPRSVRCKTNSAVRRGCNANCADAHSIDADGRGRSVWHAWPKGAQRPSGWPCILSDRLERRESMRGPSAERSKARCVRCRFSGV